MSDKVVLKRKTFIFIVGFLIVAALLFRNGDDEPGTVKKQKAAASSPSQVVASNRQLPPPVPQSESEEDAADIMSAEIFAQNAANIRDSNNQQTPLQLIEAYMTAWSGANRSEISLLWEEIKQCRECLERIAELLINQGVPQGMLLELTYQLIELGDESILPVFDYLLQPSVELNTRVILTQQMIKDGRHMYVKKLFDILQQADMDGYKDFAHKHAWMISKLKNPDGISAIFDVISGRSGPSADFAAHVSNIFSNTLIGMKQHPDMTDAMVNYYLSADELEQSRLWGVISLDTESLVSLSINAQQSGSMNQFTKYSQTLAGINSIGSVEGLLELRASVDYSQEYFSGLMQTLVQRYHNLEILRKLEDYLRDPQRDLQTRLVAAEGLLSVKESEQARYILQKAINSGAYEDSEIVAYINSRL